jgi:hypothetical protein
MAMTLASAADSSGPLRPPAVPLVTHDPYFSIWSPADKLTDADTVHWTGKPHRLSSLMQIDGKAFRVMGKEASTENSSGGWVSGKRPNLPAFPQTSVVVLPTRTIYTFEGQGVRLTLTFMTAALPDDLMICSRPVTYVTWEVAAMDGATHDVKANLDANPEIAVNGRKQEVETSMQHGENLAVLGVRTVDQPVLRKKGDDLRIDWGRLYLATAEPPSGRQQTLLQADRGTWWLTDKGSLPSRCAPARFSLDDPLAQILTAYFDFGTVGTKPVSRWLMFAYDDEFSIKYFRQNLRPYWRRHGDDAAALLKKAAADYESLKQRCEKFDAALMADLRKVGGEQYARLCALAYRQTFAGNKIVADANGQPLMFPKENFSNGCIGTVDVLFPQAPFFLLFSPALTKAMLVPILDYAASPRWPYGYAPHDLGTYPHATGQVYGMGGSDGDRMPVEESGNMLIMLAALAKEEGNADLAKKYWPILAKWADYLVREGLDPTNQLCSADMFGHLPRNANLALKAIIGIGGFAQLCELAGRAGDAQKYAAIAHDYAAKWQNLAEDDGRTRLAYDQPGTWSMKHNLIWDRILSGSRRRESAPTAGTANSAPTHVGGYQQLFPTAVGDAEIAWYLKVQKKYGLPVDNRTDTSLIDWALWSIALARSDADFQALCEPIYRYANETPSRVPLSDWFVTTDARQKGFQARPVVGGIFIKMLADAPMWAKWAGRGANVNGPWAPIPLDATAKEVVPTSQKEPDARIKLPGLRKLMDTPLRDTSICCGPDGTWYLTGTVEPFWGFNEGIKLWKSADLTNWTALGFVWKYGASPWHTKFLEAKKPLWAPEVHYLKGTFWLTYSMPGWDGTAKTSGSGLLKSTTGKPEGPYADMQPAERMGDEIDASLFEDDDGAVYFLWHSGKIARLKPDMSGLAEPYHWLRTAVSDPNPNHHSGLCAGIFGKDSFDHVGYEGMFLFKRAGRYYLSCSENFDGRYSCAVATSTNLFGPYGERYEAIPHGGHNVFFEDGKGQWWSTYFGSDDTAPWQERPGILPICFDESGRVQPK